MVSRIVDGGVNILMTNGSFGEGATLTWQEHQDFTACVANTLDRRGLLFAGVTTLNTRETIMRARGLMRLGADGLFLGRPMWMALDAPGINPVLPGRSPKHCPACRSSSTTTIWPSKARFPRTPIWL